MPDRYADRHPGRLLPGETGTTRPLPVALTLQYNRTPKYLYSI